MRGRRALIAALVLLVSAVGARASSERAAHKFSPEGLAKVSDYIRNEIATGKIPGAILLLQQHGKPVYYENFGVRDVATEMSMRSRADASRVNSPASTRTPHAISTTPTNGALNCGNGMPIFTKRPTPSASGYRNF